MMALDAGKMMTEAEASAKSVEEIVAMVAFGLGAEQVELRIGYGSLAITIGRDGSGITRMRSVGRRGVNLRLEQALWNLAERVSRGGFTPEQVRFEIARIGKDTPRHPAWFMAVAVGAACGAFGRLLGVDWFGIGPVFVAAGIGQYARRALLSRHVNAFICATVVSLLSSLLASLGARWAGSGTVTMAMLASVLFLVPGVPAVNAQNDILEGHPTLGSARAMTVVMMLIFMAAGLWIGPVQLNLWR
jgi:uncharacterized membrane protein YjjP (DUF1212 family)